jgi:signal transduction histidine kinase
MVGRDLSRHLPLASLGSEPSQMFASAELDRTVGLAWVAGWPLVVMVATDTDLLIWDWAFVAGALGLAGILVAAGTAVTLRLAARYLSRLADTETELRLHVVDLEISRLQLQQQGEEATGLAEALYVAREEAEQARFEAESARRAADQANQAKSEFLARMSHELRTPLNAILGFAEIMKEGIGAAGKNDTYTQYSQDIFDSGSHLLSVINDILDLSKVEAGRFELAEEQVDLQYAAKSVAKLVRETAAKRGLKMLVEAPGDIPRIRSDQRVVRQMLLNLLSNSLKFTPRGGSVFVQVAGDGDGIAVQVRDTGIGIDEQHIAKVLQPFGQVRDPSTEDVQGTGLGLPLVKSFIEAQGGRFELASRVGEGTTVTLWFPPERIICPRAAASSCEAEPALSEAC